MPGRPRARAHARHSGPSRWTTISRAERLLETQKYGTHRSSICTSPTRSRSRAPLRRPPSSDSSGSVRSRRQWPNDLLVPRAPWSARSHPSAYSAAMNAPMLVPPIMSTGTAGFSERLEHADVREPARAAAAQRDADRAPGDEACHARARRRARRRRGRGDGARPGAARATAWCPTAASCSAGCSRTRLVGRPRSRRRPSEVALVGAGRRDRRRRGPPRAGGRRGARTRWSTRDCAASASRTRSDSAAPARRSTRRPGGTRIVRPAPGPRPACRGERSRSAALTCSVGPERRRARPRVAARTPPSGTLAVRPRSAR